MTSTIDHLSGPALKGNTSPAGNRAAVINPLAFLLSFHVFPEYLQALYVEHLLS